MDENTTKLGVPPAPFPLSEITRRQIAELVASGFGSAGEVIKIAIDRLWVQERALASIREEYFGQTVCLRQHVPSGDYYVTAEVGNDIIAAAGPLEQAEIARVKEHGTYVYGIQWHRLMGEKIAANADVFPVVDGPYP
jgi:hypothetical protein